MRPSSHSAAIFGSIGSDSSTGRPWSAAVCATFDAPNTENVSPQCGQTTPLIFSTSPRIGTFIIDAIRTEGDSIEGITSANGYSFDESNNPIKDANIMELVGGAETFKEIF